ncbi:unnamed protein product [Closterium sp. NIES-54]
MGVRVHSIHFGSPPSAVITSIPFATSLRSGTPAFLVDGVLVVAPALARLTSVPSPVPSCPAPAYCPSLYSSAPLQAIRAHSTSCSTSSPSSSLAYIPASASPLGPDARSYACNLLIRGSPGPSLSLIAVLCLMSSLLAYLAPGIIWAFLPPMPWLPAAITVLAVPVDVSQLPIPVTRPGVNSCLPSPIRPSSPFWYHCCRPALLEPAPLPAPESLSWSCSPVDCSFSRRTGLHGSSVLPSAPVVALASNTAPPTPPDVSPAVDVSPARASIHLSPSRAAAGHLPGASHRPALPLARGGSWASADRRRTSIPATPISAENAIPPTAVLPSASAARATVSPPSAWLPPTVPPPSNVLPPPAHVLRLFLCEIPVPAPCWDLPRGCDAPAAARHLGGFLPLGQAVPRVAPPVPSSAPPLPPCLGRRLRLLAWIPPLLLWRDRRGLRLSGRRSIPGPRPHLLHFPLTPPPVFGWPGVFLPPCRPQSLFPGRGEAPLARASDLARRVAVPLLPANGIPQCGDGDCDRLRFRETFPSAMATHSLTRQISRRLLHRASNYLPVGPVLPRPDLRGRPAS